MEDKLKSGAFKSLISVIVPAYNVEKYIDKCIMSILNQTHINIELIVVDDGSTDKTGELIDIISKRDSRIIVLHKKNAGVSAARNSGIEISTGDYLVFVDGDDYIADDYVEYMINLINKTESEFCLSKRCYTKKDEGQTDNDYVQKLNSEDAITLLLSPEVIVGCWNKIFKRSLIIDNNLWFSTDLFYGEGLLFITNVAQICKSVGVGNRKVYYYRKNNEVSATTKFDIDKIYNGENALRNIKDQLTTNTPKINKMLDYHLCLYRVGALVRIKSNGLEKKYPEDYKRWLSYIRKNAYKFLLFGEISMYRKILVMGGFISPWLMMKLDIIRRRRIFVNSIDN